MVNFKTTGKRILAFLGSFFALMLFIEQFPRSKVYAADFAGGDGSERSPYQITTAEHLEKVNDYVGDPNVHFELMNDIDLTNYLAPGGAGHNKWGAEGWNPISWVGNIYGGDECFQGKFDGNNHKIKGLWINRPVMGVGLFGTVIDSASIKNLNVEIAAQGITGGQNTGGLLGRDSGDNLTITNCHVTGSVSGITQTGGLIGNASSNANITNCSANCEVSGASNVGGCVGNFRSGTIKNCNATGNIYATGDSAGGFIGGVSGLFADTHIINCYATGNVNSTSTSSAGGLIGVSSRMNITNCYATGNVSIPGGDNAGGLVGWTQFGTITDCYSMGNVNGLDCIGSFAGYNLGTLDTGIIKDCYATGVATGTGTKFGGLLGWNNNGIIINSIFNYSVNAINGVGVDTTASAVVYGETTNDMKNIATYTTNLDESWNFEETWYMKENVNDGYPDLQVFASEEGEPPVGPGGELVTRTITYKNYDGSEIINVDPSLPTTYTEGVGIDIPNIAPNSEMADFTFLGYWDEALDLNKKVKVEGVGYENEEQLDLTVGTKVTEISASSRGDRIIFARYTSEKLDTFVNGIENYIFGAPGVFPNNAVADMRVLTPGTEEYENTFKLVDEQDHNNIKIVEFGVYTDETKTKKIQPNAFFGPAIIGFKIPEGFSVDDLSIIRVTAAGEEDITLRSKVWTDPESGHQYIEGYTDHFSPYALLDLLKEFENAPKTGDNTMVIVVGALVFSILSLGAFNLLRRKKA